MKVTAGVLLIVAAIFNLFGSLGYLLGGSLFGGGAALLGSIEVPDQAVADTAGTAALAMGAGSALLMALGIFLIVSVGILIAGAVFLFKNSKPGFIKVAGGVAIAAEVFGIALVTFGVINVVGLVAGILAIIAAIGMKPKDNTITDSAV